VNARRSRCHEVGKSEILTALRAAVISVQRSVRGWRCVNSGASVVCCVTMATKRKRRYQYASADNTARWFIMSVAPLLTPYMMSLRDKVAHRRRTRRCYNGYRLRRALPLRSSLCALITAVRRYASAGCRHGGARGESGSSTGALMLFAMRAFSMLRAQQQSVYGSSKEAEKVGSYAKR